MGGTINKRKNKKGYWGQIVVSTVGITILEYSEESILLFCVSFSLDQWASFYPTTDHRARDKGINGSVHTVP
jgi:hypothetical protein